MNSHCKCLRLGCFNRTKQYGRTNNRNNSAISATFGKPISEEIAEGFRLAERIDKATEIIHKILA